MGLTCSSRERASRRQTKIPYRSGLEKGTRIVVLRVKGSPTYALARFIEGSEMIVLTRFRALEQIFEHQGIAHAGLAAKTYIGRFKQMPKVDVLQCVLEQILR